MIISGWCVVAIVALIAGAAASIKTKDSDSFGSAILLTLLIGFGYLITLGY